MASLRRYRPRIIAVEPNPAIFRLVLLQAYISRALSAAIFLQIANFYARPFVRFDSAQYMMPLNKTAPNIILKIYLDAFQNVHKHSVIQCCESSSNAL